jgi:hypothetical protein
MWFKQIALVSLAVGLSSSASFAQQPFDPLNAREIDIAKGALLTSVTVQQSLGSQPYYTIINVERHNEPKGTTAGGRRADVILFNYTTNETISAVVNLAGTPRIDALRVTKEPPPPLGTEETEAAKQMAFANPAVQARLQVAGVAASDPSLIVTHLFGRAEDTRDVCSRNRCVVLFFNTAARFLFPAVVDLTARNVRIVDAPER